MAAGCKNSRAINYSPTANPENYSCVYLLKNQDNCHWFRDMLPDDGVQHSFTMSYALKGQYWVFFHDYFPDMYIHTREKLFNAHQNDLYEHHAGHPGDYYEDPYPFFIDVVFQNDKNLILETVNWITDYLQGTTVQPFNTLTHITIWNSHQHTTRIALSTLQPFKNFTARSTKGEWSMKDFRNLLIDKGVEFLQDIFHDYLVVADQVNAGQPWYKKELLTDKWFCVRFEFDNLTEGPRQVILHETTIQAQISDR